MYKFRNFRKKNEKEGRKWFNKKIKEYYHQLMKQREKELRK